MLRSSAFLFLLSTLSVGAAATDPMLPDHDAPATALKPRVITQAVPHDSDDPALWINQKDLAASLVIGTDKHKNGALYAFDLQGRIVGKSVPLARPNNVDIVQGWKSSPEVESVDLAVTTERGQQRLRCFQLPGLSLRDRGELRVFDGDTTRAPMGIALYKRPSDGALFAIVGGKSGPTWGYLWQYRLSLDSDGMVSMKKVREFGHYSGIKEIEAICVDSESGYVYYSDEKYGIHKYHADPEHPEAAKELALFGTSGFAHDIEGISIRRSGPLSGHILVSNQQADTFRVFPREGSSSSPHHHPLLGSVRVSTRESDGSDISSEALPGFPGGLFVAMSTDRTFHYYAWEDIHAVLAAGKE